jgi:hypothetical protein
MEKEAQRVIRNCLFITRINIRVEKLYSTPPTT